MYDIMMDTKVVGQAEVMKEGLYYRFTCKCTPPNDAIHRIIVSDGNITRDLGICVPTGEWFCLVCRVPIKYLPGDKLEFSLVTNAQKNAVPVETDTPFPALDKLETAYLQKNGEIVIDQAQDQPDSDPNQESRNKWVQP